MTVQELETLFKSGDDLPLLLDVRMPLERDIALLVPSVIIPLYELTSRVSELEPFREKPIIVYCHHGVRSAHAVHWLTEAGFTQAVNLEGGIDAWSLDIDSGTPRY